MKSKSHTRWWREAVGQTASPPGAPVRGFIPGTINGQGGSSMAGFKGGARQDEQAYVEGGPAAVQKRLAEPDRTI